METWNYFFLTKSRTWLWVIVVSLDLVNSMNSLGQSTFDLQGHRGCRGLMPENTIPAFLRAVELGVNTLEMDVVISRDHEVVVSHEPWMSHVICSHPDGKPVEKKEEKKLDLYTMNYQEIQQYDCGLRQHPKFPDQKKVQAVKPTLKIVVRSVGKFARDKNLASPDYNIEIKSDKKGDNEFHPEPAMFVRLVVDEIRRLDIEEKTTLQSFDIRVLEELNKVINRKFNIAYLVERGKDINKNLARLSFIPQIYSPKYTLISASDVAACHSKGIRIIPWTINTRLEMDNLRSWGIDGGITDFPDIMK